VSADARTRIAASLLWSVLLAGCASILTPAKPPAAASAEPFELQGRVYVRYGARAFSGSLRWQHAQAADQVWLSGPLGQTAAYIRRDGEGAVLTTAEQREYRSTSLERLTKDGLGWSLPLADLSYYVLGEVPPAVVDSSVERDAERRAVRVTHDGWEVALTRSDADASARAPARVTLRKDDVEIRLVIDRLDAPAG
jgi:outer membrane lipoprotein LolB